MALAMREVITGADQLTVAWLTDVLRQAGVLATGQVTSIDRADTHLPGISQFTRLHVHYDPVAPPAAPAELFLKRSPPIGDALQPFMRNQEVAFYQLVGEYAPELPLARCYDAASDAATGAYHVLLADLTATHSAGVAGMCRPRWPRASNSSTRSRRSMPIGGTILPYRSALVRGRAQPRRWRLRSGPRAPTRPSSTCWVIAYRRSVGA